MVVFIREMVVDEDGRSAEFCSENFDMKLVFSLPF